MKPTSSFIAASSVILLSACSIFGSHGSSGADASSQASDPVQWKEVTRMVAGNVVTYKVPVGQKVNSIIEERDLSGFDARTKPAQANALPAHGSAGSAQSQQKSVVGGSQAPLSRQAPDASRVAANAAVPVPASTAPSSSISQDAEVALGQAEIMVRDAQGRFETAQAALNRARDAARNGDSVSVIKFSRTAQALAHPGP